MQCTNSDNITNAADIDALESSKLNLSGGTMSGNLNLGAKGLENVGKATFTNLATFNNSTNLRLFLTQQIFRSYTIRI